MTLADRPSDRPSDTGAARAGARIDEVTRSLADRLAERARRKASWFVAALALGLALLAWNGGGQPTDLALGASSTSTVVTAPVWVYCGVGALVAAACAVAVHRMRRATGRVRSVPVLVALGVLAGVVGVVAWAARGGQASLGGILALSVVAAVPIILGSTSGALAERSGTFNIAIEGQLLVGAFSSALVASVTRSAWLGLLVAPLAGLGLGALLAVLTIRFRVPQVVAGFVLVALGTSLTAYLAEQIMVPDLATYNSPPVFTVWEIPLLSDIPVVGPALFAQGPILYLAVLIVVVVEFVLRRTRLGLRVRAVGEAPQAVESSGIDARRIRFWGTAVSGAIAGIGGAALTIGSAGQFVAGMSSGLGFVALAAVILGSWRVAQGAASALLFGFASSVSAVFGLLAVAVPPPLLMTAPYVVTILVVAGVVAKGRGPAAAGGVLD